jgi:hypothetical protein
MAKPEHAGRPTNEELYNKEPDIQPGTEQAVAAVQAAYPNSKILEAKTEGTGYEVTAGYIDEQNAYHIVECELDASCTIVSQEERPNEAPGQAKKP